MFRVEGYWQVKPEIKSLSFPKRGKFQVNLLFRGYSHRADIRRLR